MKVKERIGGLSPRILMDPHSIWMGENNHKNNSSLIGQAYHLTWRTNIYRKKINHTWAPSATPKRPHTNTGKGYPIRARSRTRLVTTIHEVKRHQCCLPQDSGSNRKKLYGPIRKVPSYIQQGQHVYPGRISL